MMELAVFFIIIIAVLFGYTATRNIGFPRHNSNNLPGHKKPPPHPTVSETKKKIRRKIIDDLLK